MPRAGEQRNSKDNWSLGLKPLAEDDLDNLNLDELITRMDEILAAPCWWRPGNEIMKLRVCALMNTKRAQSFASEFQRKVAYKTFGFLLQLLYTQFSRSARFFNASGKDGAAAPQLHSAAREQWCVISSRIAFEYFMQLTYMLGTGEDFRSGKSTFKKFRRWLKQPGNPYTYFSISVARAAKFDRRKRSPEVHGGTKLARRILLLTKEGHDSEVGSLFNIIQNQWQFVIDIADERHPNGWVASGPGPVTDDREWYKLWNSGDEAAIHKEVDIMLDSVLNLMETEVTG